MPANLSTSPAGASIQSVLDRIKKSAGYHYGATFTLAPGLYRINSPIILGTDPGHWGLNIAMHGAYLLGTAKLGEDPMFILNNPHHPGIEGGGYKFHGGFCDREIRHSGPAFYFPPDQSPKSCAFYDTTIKDQSIGIHVDYCWDLMFQHLNFYGCKIGCLAQNSANDLSFLGCYFRYSRVAGLQIGPDKGQRASSGVLVSGGGVESNSGFGIKSYSGMNMKIDTVRFEANGNAIGCFSSFRNTVIDNCLMLGKYPYNSLREYATEYSDKGYVVIGKGAREPLLRDVVAYTDTMPMEYREV